MGEAGKCGEASPRVAAAEMGLCAHRDIIYPGKR